MTYTTLLEGTGHLSRTTAQSPKMSKQRYDLCEPNVSFNFAQDEQDFGSAGGDEREREKETK